MGTKVNNFQNNAKNSNIILTSESNEMEFSKEVKTVSSFKNSDFGELKIMVNTSMFVQERFLKIQRFHYENGCWLVILLLK